MRQPELNRFFVDAVGLGLNDGIAFGPEGEGFMRMNIATQRCHVEEAMSRLPRAVANVDG